MDSLITPEAVAMIGMETSRSTTVVERKESQRWAAAVGDLNPLYFDEDYARGQGHRGILVPPLFLWQVSSGVTHLDTLAVDGIAHRPGGPDIPLKAPRRMWGGTEVEYFAPAYVGDEITAVSRIANIEQKSGRQGPFVLIVSEIDYTNQSDELLARVRTTVIAK